MTDDRIDHAVAAITELIETAAFNPDRWDDVIDAIWRQLPGTQVVFHTRDETIPGTSPVLLRGWNSEHIASYEAHYAALNPWVGVRASAPVMVPVWTEDTHPASSFKNSEFYTDWLSKAGEVLCATGIKLLQEKGRNASLDIHYGLEHGEASHRRSRRLLNGIGPSLHRSIRAMRLMQKSEGGGVLGMLLDAAFIVAASGTVTALNAAAQELVDNGVIELRAPAGRLSVRSAIADQELYREITLAYWGDPPSQSGVIRTTAADALLLISVFPIAHPDSSQAGMASLFHPRREVLVVVRRRPRGVKDEVQHLVSRFGLSPAETRLVSALKDGMTLGQTAAQLGIAYETARSHLRSVFSKTGVRRQVDLIRLLTSAEG